MTALVGIGLAAIATDKVVSEHGAEVIAGPASAMMVRLQPLGAAAEDRFLAFVDSWRTDGGPAAGNHAVAPAANVAAAEAAGGASISSADEGAEGRRDAPRAAAPQTAPDVRVSELCEGKAGGVDVVVLGDRLALRFFERSALAAAPSADGSPRSDSIVFERLDLSGSYEIGANGAVSLPAIGHVDVIGRSLPCVEALVTLAASERLRLNGSVSAAFASRPPVLVRGMVRAPGAHAYSPGLTVERVLAQAGAIEKIEPLSTLQLAGLRARERELDALDASLLIERVRIDVALDGDVEFAADAEAWEAAAEALGADRNRVATERDLLLSEIAEEKAQQDRTLDRIDGLLQRISAAREHFQVTEKHLSYLAERHKRLSDRLQHGITTESSVEEAMARVMVVERSALERRDALLQLKAELRIAQHETTVREAERRNHLALAALATSKERSSVREQLRTVRAQLAVQGRDNARTFAVTVQRPEPDGVDRFAAGPETSLRPGDLVTIASAEGRHARAETPVAVPDLSVSSNNSALPVSWR